MKKPRKKPNNKDLLYNIALNKRMIMELQQRLIWLEEVINKYIEMKKDTKKYNKFLQEQIEKAADEEAQIIKETVKSDD
jgi:hypothetical protein|tara:strand:+ start:221 stop:457 length:237 start_codon:yes stop_codon:yes gene_type:complete